MTFFKWRIETKIERLDADDRILFLAEKLLKEVKNKNDYKFEFYDSCDVGQHENYTVHVSYNSSEAEFGLARIGGEQDEI